MAFICNTNGGRKGIIQKTIGVLGHNSALQGYTGPGTTWANGIILLRVMLLTQVSCIIILCVLVSYIKHQSHIDQGLQEDSHFLRHDKHIYTVSTR